MSYRGFLINTCTVKTADYDDLGEPIGDTEVVERCRIEYMTKIVRTPNGEDKLTSARVFLTRNTAAEGHSRLNFDGVDHPILTLEKSQNARAVHHVEAYVG